MTGMPTFAIVLTSLVLLASAAPAEADDAPPPPPPQTTAVDAVSCLPDDVCAEERSHIRLGGYLQMWWTVYEQSENGKVQPWTGDDGADVASGFSFRRARLAADISACGLEGRVELGLEGTPKILDAWAGKSFRGGRIGVWAGQMKVPSTYEVETASSELDFATRSAFSAQVVNWSLCRSPSMASQFYGVRTHLRDLGVALRGKIGGLRYFAMVGNGLGANLYIGGSENKQYLFANDVGASLYAGRVSYDFACMLRGAGCGRMIRRLEIGGHCSLNDHPNAIFNDEKTVLDIERWSWSADVRVNLFDRIRLTGMIGEGAVEDDVDYDNTPDYRYSGWEAKAMFVVIPRRLEVGIRHDVYEEEFFENGAVDRLSSTTIGANYRPHRNVRLQLNYKFKHLDSPTDPDLDDDVLLLVGQFDF